MMPATIASFKPDRFCYTFYRAIQRSSTIASAQAILRLHFLSGVAGGDHPRCLGRQRRLRLAPDRRRQIALLSVAGHDADRADGGRVAADCLDEGPGGWVAGEWCGGDFS